MIYIISLGLLLIFLIEIKLQKWVNFIRLRYDKSYSWPKKNIITKGVKSILTEIYRDSYENNFQLKEIDKSKYLTKLIDTGWIIARDNEGLELILKIGDSCPKYLPAHTHSDLLSFDLFKNGSPLIIETGTSLYGNNNDRYYERSAAAHNVFQLAPFEGYKKNRINWIEPIEVWGNFRAARKAKVIEKSCDHDIKNNIIWIRGSNDAYYRFGAKHVRNISLKISSGNKTQLRVVDEVTCCKKMHWRQFWHLGPEQNEDILRDMRYEIEIRDMRDMRDIIFCIFCDFFFLILIFFLFIHV